MGVIDTLNSVEESVCVCGCARYCHSPIDGGCGNCQCGKYRPVPPDAPRAPRIFPIKGIMVQGRRYGGLGATCGYDRNRCVRAWTLAWMLCGKPADKAACKEAVTGGRFMFSGRVVNDPLAPCKPAPGVRFSVGRRVGVFE